MFERYVRCTLGNNVTKSCKWEQKDTLSLLNNVGNDNVIITQFC